VVARVADIFCIFYLAQKQKSDNNSTNTDARDKINADLESLKFYSSFDAHLTKIKKQSFFTEYN
jgi:hypothetical protein